MNRPTTLDMSIVIPVAPWDNTWPQLLKELDSLFLDKSVDAGLKLEIIGVGPTKPDEWPDGGDDKIDCLRLKKHIRWEPAALGRAKQQNQGAATAAGKWLWFLHSDSRFGGQNPTSALANILRSDPEPATTLFYSRLAFFDGPPALSINAFVVNFLRCKLLKMPFGDQGFLLPKSFFLGLGGFDEKVPSGEDHYLIWKVRARGGQVKAMPLKIETSGRKYAEKGWARTTSLHVWMTILQAIKGLALS